MGATRSVLVVRLREAGRARPAATSKPLRSDTVACFGHPRAETRGPSIRSFSSGCSWWDYFARDPVFESPWGGSLTRVAVAYRLILFWVTYLTV